MSGVLACAVVLSSVIMPAPVRYTTQSNSTAVMAESDNDYVSTADYDVWSAPYTEKILRETTIDYSRYKSMPTVALDMARAETETSQIVITAKKDIKSYDLTVTDLKSASGDVISKEKIDVYSAMYVYVDYLYDSVRKYPKGYFPDAMLPMEKTVEYAENNIPAKVNQSIYVSVTSLWNQPAGTYTGTFTLTIDGKKTDIPVSVKVRDCMVNTKVTSKSLFSDNWTHMFGELDATQRMTDQYHKALMKYRLCPSWIVDDKGYNEEDAEYLAQKVLELYRYGTDEELFGKGADRFTNFNLPIGFGSTGEGAINASIMFLNKLVEYSCKEGVNLLKLAYFYTVDEPEANGNFQGQKAAHEMFTTVKARFTALLNENKNTYKANYNISDEFYNELLESAEGLKDIVTQSYMAKYDGYIDTWCPTFDSYDSASDIAIYQQQNDERWWYGCVVPLAPYPTYHVSDILLSPRVCGWLQSYYDVTGNLYWSTEQWAGYHILPGEGRAYRFSDDYYSEAGPYDNIAGEGYLFRPGKKYGIDGPIATIRLDAIRDGLEEFEMMESIKEIYTAAGQNEHTDWSANKIMTELLAPLATGMQVGATSEAFAKSRTTLLELYELAEKGVCLVDYNDNGKGVVSFKMYVPEGADITSSEGSVTSSKKLNSGTLKTFVVDMKTAKTSTMTFTVKVSGNSYTLDMALPGKVTIINAADLTSAITGDLIENGVKVVNASDYVSGREGKFVELSLSEISASDSYGYQYVRLTSDTLKQLNSTLSKALFSFYYDGEGSLPFRLCVKYKNSLSIVEEYKGYLTNGINEIIWGNLNTKSWKNGEVEYIEFCFDDKNIGTAIAFRKVYFEGMTFYGA